MRAFWLFAIVFSSAGSVARAEKPDHAVVSFPASAHSVVSARERDQDSVAEEIAALLKDNVRETAQPFHTYHFANRENMKLGPDEKLDPSDRRVGKHVQDWAAYFWNLEQKGGRTDTLGFYLASDPVASRPFGKEDWILYRVILPEGLRVLDLKPVEGSSEKRYLPKEIQARLKALGCDDQSFRYIVRANYSRACREIGLLVLKKLGVDAIQYEWTAASFPKMRNRPESAIILLKTDKLPPENIAVFSKADDRKDGLEKERAVISSLYRMAIDQDPGPTSRSTTIENNAKLKLWSGTQEIPEEALYGWVKNHLMDAGKPTFK